MFLVCLGFVLEFVCCCNECRSSCLADLISAQDGTRHYFECFLAKG